MTEVCIQLEVLTNAIVVDDALRFVSQKSNEDEKDEAEEPDQDKDKGQFEEKQEEEAGEITSAITRNQIF